MANSDFEADQPLPSLSALPAAIYQSITIGLFHGSGRPRGPGRLGSGRVGSG